MAKFLIVLVIANVTIFAWTKTKSKRYFVTSRYKMILSGVDQEMIDSVLEETGAKEVSFWEYQFHKFDK